MGAYVSGIAKQHQQGKLKINDSSCVHSKLSFRQPLCSAPTPTPAITAPSSYKPNLVKCQSDVLFLYNSKRNQHGSWVIYTQDRLLLESSLIKIANLLDLLVTLFPCALRVEQDQDQASLANGLSGLGVAELPR